MGCHSCYYYCGSCHHNHCCPDYHRHWHGAHWCGSYCGGHSWCFSHYRCYYDFHCPKYRCYRPCCGGGGGGGDQFGNLMKASKNLELYHRHLSDSYRCRAEDIRRRRRHNSI